MQERESFAGTNFRRKGGGQGPVPKFWGTRLHTPACMTYSIHRFIGIWQPKADICMVTELEEAKVFTGQPPPPPL